MTLCLQIGWSGLGLSLASSASDAVEVLLASSRSVRLPLFSLNITAMLTTILDSYLALLSTVNDFMQRREVKTPMATITAVMMIQVCKKVKKTTRCCIERKSYR